MTTTTLEEKLALLPTKPGVYQHKDADGKVLYVGKAKNLRSRVRSYFQESRPRDGRLAILVNKIADVEIIVTDTEAEALILENNLIKKLKPRYNVNLRDDKTYPYVCITGERFPRVFPTRRIRKDGSKYFGPYTNVKSLRLVLRTIKSIFKLRTCSLNLSQDAIESGRYEPCLEYHIKNCDAPCVGLQSEESYNQTIRQVEQLLNGKTSGLIDLLRSEMNDQAAKLNFEEAAAYRDQIAALERYSQKQRIVSADALDRDAFGLAVDREQDVACGVVFKIRDGKVVGSQHKFIRRIDGVDNAGLMQSFVERYYSEASFFPEEVLLSEALSDPDPLSDLLREQQGRHVPLRVPERGDKAGLTRLVAVNAEHHLQEWVAERNRKTENRIPHSLSSLQKDLRLSTLPRRMECFDISHLAGTGTVASCVVFIDGKARPSEYRTFKIRDTPEGTPDDFASMREVVSRRYRRLIDEESDLPDLVIIDGGKGQLSSAETALKDIDAYGRFPIVGLAKRLEEVFFPHDSEPVLIPRASASLQLLQRIRNEAHRFAITFQRKQRKRSTLQSELTEIAGIGPRTAQKLLTTFGSVKRVKSASEADLVNCVGPAAAARIREHYSPTGSSSSDNPDIPS